MAFDPSILPDLNKIAAAQAPQGKSLFGSALASGGHELLASVAGAGEAVGRAIGSDRLTQGARARAVEQKAAAQAADNPVYSDDPWSPGGMVYQVAKSLPSLGAMVGGAVAVGAALPSVLPAGAMAGLTRLGMMAPEMIGGGAGAARAAAAAASVGDLTTAFAANQAAQQAGRSLATNVVGGMAAAYPLGVGANMEAAHEGGRTPGQKEGLQALALGVPQAAIGAVAPVGLMGRWGASGVGQAIRGEAPGALRSAAANAASGAVVMAPAMGLQSAANTWLTQGMGDPNASTSDRLKGVVDSFLRGALTGGVVGGALHAVSPPPGHTAAENFKAAPAQPFEGEPPIAGAAPETLLGLPAPPKLLPPPEGWTAPAPDPRVAEARGQSTLDVLVDRAEGIAPQPPVGRENVTRSGELPPPPAPEPPPPSPDKMLVDAFKRDIFATLPRTRARETIIDDIGATNPIELYRGVGQRLEQAYETGKVPKALSELADAAGYTVDGAPRDVYADVDRAAARLDAVRRSAEKFPDSKSVQGKLARAQAQFDEATRWARTHDEAFPDQRDARIGAALEKTVDEAATAEARVQNATQKRWDDVAQGDMFADLDARDRAQARDEKIVNDAMGARIAREIERRRGVDAEQRVKDDYTETTFGQTPLGDNRLAEMGDAELKMRDVFAKGETQRIPKGRLSGVRDAIRALDEGDVDAQGRLTPKQEADLRFAYKRLGLKATDVDVTRPFVDGGADADPVGRNTFTVERSAEDRDRAKVAEVLRDNFTVERTPADAERAQTNEALRPRVEIMPDGSRLIYENGRVSVVRDRAPRTPDEQLAEQAHFAAQTPGDAARLVQNEVPTPERVAEIARQRADDARDAAVEQVRQVAAEREAAARASNPFEGIPPITETPRTTKERNAAIEAARAFLQNVPNEQLPTAMRASVRKAFEAETMTPANKTVLINAVIGINKQLTRDARAFGRRSPEATAELSRRAAEQARLTQSIAEERNAATPTAENARTVEQARGLVEDAQGRANADGMLRDRLAARNAQMQARTFDPVERAAQTMSAAELTPTAAWVEPLLRAPDMRHVVSDGDYAVVRRPNAIGDPLYYGVKRKGGLVSDVPIERLSAGDGWSGAEIDNLRDMQRRAQEQDQRMSAQNPDGFFAGGKTFVASPNLPAHARAFAERLMKLTGFNGRIYLTTYEDLHALPTQVGRYGRIDAMRTHEPLLGQAKWLGNGDYAIAINRGGGKMALMETVAHEYGHVFKTQMERVLPPDVRAALDAAYKSYQDATARGTFGDTLDALTTFRHGREIGKRSQVALNEPMRLLSDADRGYWMSREEWQADQLAKWAMRHEPATSVVDQFFQGLGRKLRQIYDALIGSKARPEQTFARFLDNVSELSRRDEIASAYARRVGDAFDPAPSGPMARRAGAAPPIREQNASMADVADKVKDAAKTLREVVRGANMSEFARKWGWGLFGTPEMVAHVEKFAPAQRAFYDGVGNRDNSRIQLSETLGKTVDAAVALPRSAADSFNKLMGYAAQNFDPTRPYEAHTWFSPSEEAWARPAHAAAVREFERFRQIAPEGSKDLFQRAQLDAQTQRMLDVSANMVDLVRDSIDPEIAKQFRNPMETVRVSDEARGDPKAVNDIVRRDVTNNFAVMDGYLKAQRQILDDAVAAAARRSFKDAAAERAKLASDRERLDYLDQQVKTVRDILETKQPYAHAGRSGDYFVSARLFRKDGVISDETKQGMIDLLREKGFRDYVMNETPDQARLFIRVEQAHTAQELFNVLKKEGLDRGLIYDDGAEHAMRLGHVKTIGDFAAEFRVGNQYLLRKLKERSRDDNLSVEQRKQNERMIATYSRLIFESLPVSSMQRLNAYKEMVHGYDPNLIQSMAYRTKRSLDYLANRSYSHDLLERQIAMENEVKGLQTKGNIEEINDATHSMNELLQREYRRSEPTRVDRMVSLAKQGTNAFYLFASPAHLTQMMTQPFVTALPQLAKTHSFAQSSAALMKNLPVAIRVMKAVFSAENSAAALDRESLKRIGLSPAKIDTLMSAEHAGMLSIGGFIHDIAEAARGTTQGATTGKVEMAMRLTGMLNTYAETASRVVVALAAHDVYTAGPQKNVGLQAFVNRTIENGMGDLSSRAAMRYEGANPGTRILFQFTRYPVYLLSKLYNETFNAFSKRASAQERTEAWRFLRAHLAAVGTLAGTLSFPGAELFAGLGSKVMNQITGKDDWDLEGSYRDFLLHTLGPGLGDVVAKGAPRALGIDLSRTLGEGGVIPLTSLLADRRKMEDAMKDWASDTMGASTSTAMSLIEAGRDFLDHNYARGWQKLLPTALRGPVDAIKMSRYGWENSAGKPTAMSPPTTAEIALRAAGMTPTRKAAMNESVVANQQLQAARDYRSNVIRENLLRAASHGDMSDFNLWARKANEMAMDHPESPIMLGLTQALMQQRMNAARGVALGTPAGVNPMDMRRVQQLQGYGMGLR